MNCYTCNQSIKRPQSQLKSDKNFCNHECYAKYKSTNWKNESNPRWNNGTAKFFCKTCFKPCERKKNGKIINKYCSITCAAKDRDVKGEKHHNWKGGTSTRYLRKIAPRPKPDACEVCKKDASLLKKGLQYDHCHKTNKFRGWLCTNCNTALGLVKENTQTLKALIEYIELNENLL